MSNPPYAALLALHLLAVATFLAGLIVAASSLPSLTRVAPFPAERMPELQRLRRMNLWVTTPALLFVWIFGAGMTIGAGWYVTGWWQAKVALVLVLTAMHALQSSKLARLARGRAVATTGFRSLAVIALLLVAIGTLVVAKPF